MHILLIHQAFATEDEPGGTRHYEIGKHLAVNGHRLTIVASTVSYQTRQRVSQKHGPAGGDETLRILRAWTYAARRDGFVTRLLGFFSFMVSSMAKGLMVRKVDAVWGTSPPIFQAVTAYLLAKWKRVPFVLEVRDLWPDFAIHMEVLRNGTLIWLSRRLEQFLYRHANTIVVNSPGFIPHLLSCGVPAHQINLVPNGVDTAMFSGADGRVIRNEMDLIGKFVAMYAGAHGMANDLGTVLEAAKRLCDHQEIVFALVGDGTQRQALMEQAQADHLTNVLFIPAQPKARTPAFLATADVCIAILKAVPMLDTTYPNKVFDYMAASRPTVLAIDGVIREVIEKADGGLFVQPGNAQALAEAILTYSRNPELCRHQGNSARKYVELHFGRPLQAAKLQEVFQRAIRDNVMKSLLGRAFKRLLDLAGAIVGLVVLAIPFTLIAVAIKLDSSGPVFYRDPRAGKKGWLFRPWKFRTMIHGATKIGLGYTIAQDDSRITRVGRILRNTGVDELPQLINVLKCEMSLVGPRPTWPYQVDRYDDTQLRRLLAKPGITGVAVVRGRNALSWEERIKLDNWYSDHWSAWLDLKVLALTPWKVLVTREGLYGNKGVNDDFGGSPPDSETKDS
jgi:lipopolysaccharide/colanic/teichoic acid biosynthesis glycosyltransferase